MGFPSPAQDYEDKGISLDERFIKDPSATYFMRAASTYYQAGIIQGALLVIDSSLSPCDGSLLICAVDGELKIKRYRVIPRPYLEDLQTGRREEIPRDNDDGYSNQRAVFGVITYIINDACLGEFDDCPVM
ncbi:S24 family peptidase [Klebsiella aerogenes]|uniref:HumD family translesion DNA polymerase n=1 Tax=Klebsiella aerogenes TaxID=548 RepID=UPI002A6B864C|nr:S24 family peptidase [Klebsiella aerogenes]MDY0856226.1 S24 family peptidase [Klebsiella aerogenes]MDY0864769.1 S24 family peptidase [Klebsiella aerogenes]